MQPFHESTIPSNNNNKNPLQFHIPIISRVLSFYCVTNLQDPFNLRLISSSWQDAIESFSASMIWRHALITSMNEGQNELLLLNDFFMKFFFPKIRPKGLLEPEQHHLWIVHRIAETDISPLNEIILRDTSIDESKRGRNSVFLVQARLARAMANYSHRISTIENKTSLLFYCIFEASNVSSSIIDDSSSDSSSCIEALRILWQDGVVLKGSIQLNRKKESNFSTVFKEIFVNNKTSWKLTSLNFAEIASIEPVSVLPFACIFGHHAKVLEILFEGVEELFLVRGHLSLDLLHELFLISSSNDGGNKYECRAFSLFALACIYNRPQALRFLIAKLKQYLSLISSSSSNDESNTRSWLQKFIDTPDYTCRMTPLAHASAMDNAECCRILIEEGKVDVHNHHQDRISIERVRTHAIAMRAIEKVTLIRRLSGTCSPFFLACHLNRVNVVEYFLLDLFSPGDDEIWREKNGGSGKQRGLTPFEVSMMHLLGGSKLIGLWMGENRMKRNFVAPEILKKNDRIRSIVQGVLDSPSVIGCYDHFVSLKKASGLKESDPGNHWTFRDED